jgi:GTP-binding protein Era
MMKPNRGRPVSRSAGSPPHRGTTSETLIGARTVQEERRKSGVVALIGRPNAGKSTLLNRLIGEKIAIVSDKPQTTRTRITGVLTRPEGQIVFLDTPGIHKPGYKLNRRMMAVVTDALSTVDLILLLIDATSPIGHGDEFVLEMLKRVNTRAFLLPNKVDALRDKTKLLPLIGRYTGECEFIEVIPISALTGDGAEVLVQKIFEYLPPGPLLYPEDEMTDQPERVLAAELVREKILQVTGEELPYVTAVVTERWEEDQDITRIHCLIYVERPSHKAIVIGKAGARLKEIGTKARADIETLLGRRVFLNLFVKVRESWRDDERALDELGIR